MELLCAEASSVPHETYYPKCSRRGKLRAGCSIPNLLDYVNNLAVIDQMFILRIYVFKWMKFWLGTAPPAHTDELWLTITVSDISF